MRRFGIMSGGRSHIKGGPEGEDGPYKKDGRHDDFSDGPIPREGRRPTNSNVEKINGVPFAKRGKGL
ncbi:MAG: hypothetical protein WC229_00370 [Candidatus Paceibacterota bacterium]|jgi:hypothetical protein